MSALGIVVVGKITEGRVTPVPLTDTVKDMVEAMAVSQGITKMKFTNKKGETLAHQDWIAGVDYDAINNPVETEGIDGDIEEQHIDKIFEDEPREVEQTNLTRGSLVEDVEMIDKTTKDNKDMEQVINEMIDELNDEIIPAGEELLNDIAEEPEESTEDPVDRLLRPTRDR